MVAAGLDTWEGETPGPFTGTTEAERLEAVKLAVALGNDVNARTNFGDYPMEGEVAYTLLYYPLNIDKLVDLGVGDPRWNGVTPLIGAIMSNQPSIVQYLDRSGRGRERQDAARLDAAARGGGRVLLQREEGVPGCRGDHQEGDGASRSVRLQPDPHRPRRSRRLGAR